MKRNETTEPELMPLGRTAIRLGVPIDWLRSEAEAGRVPHLRTGGLFYFDPLATYRVLAERATKEGMKIDDA